MPVVKSAKPNKRDPRELAEAIWAWWLRTARSSLAPLPPEIELSRRFGVTRHAIRGALQVLQDEGRVQRAGRRGALIVSRDPGPSRASAPPRSVNIIQDGALEVPRALEFVVQDYLRGYTAALDRCDTKMRFEVCEPGHTDFTSLFWPEAIIREQGCLLVNLSHWPTRDALIRWLGEHSVPFVVQNYRYYPAEGVPAHHRVYVNKNGAAFDATRRLLELGHERIGFVGLLRPVSAGASEVDGYAAALRSAGRERAPEHVLDLSIERVEDAVGPLTRFLDQSRRPTAMVAGNDAMAAAALEAAAGLGLEVPRDLSVIGINDQPLAARTSPPLTTMAVPRFELAKTAMEALLRVAGEPPAEFERIILDCSLVTRGTVAPPEPS